MIRLSSPAVNPFSFSRTVLLCLPSFAFTASLLFVGLFSIRFYEELGVDINALLLVVSVARGLEAMWDPALASHLDNSLLTVKLDGDGLQIPILLRSFVMSEVVCAASIVAHFTPPNSLSSTMLTCWYAFSYLLFTASFSCISVPVQVLMWSRHPYHGSTGASSSQLWTSLISGSLECMGLIFVFLVGFGNVFVSTMSDRGTVDVDQFYSSCYSSSGIGYSCLQDPSTNKRHAFELFGSSASSCQPASTSRDSSALYNPQSCARLVELTHSARQCLANYCVCVSECTNLHHFDNKRTGMMIVGCVLAASFVLSSAVVVFSEYNWRDLFDSGPSPRRANAAAAAAAASGMDFNWVLTRLNRFRRNWSMSRLVSRSAGGGPSPDDRSLDPRNSSSSSRWEPFVGRWVSTLKNPVVLSYLIPCALDAAVFVTTLGTMFYYIQIVVAPEYQSGGYQQSCNSGIAVGTYQSNDWRCRSEAVAGVVLSVLMAASLCFVCMWGWVAKHLGSVRAWQLSSIVGCLSSTSFVFSSQETTLRVPAAIGMGVLIGMSFSARCLSDCILVDVIHYFEFISGYHYPHMFWMLKTWTTKIAIVLAAIVYLPVLHEVGFESPVHFINQEQSPDVKAVSTVFTVAIPAILGLVSFVCKLRIRLCEGEQQDMIVRGLERHRARGWSSLCTRSTSSASTHKRSFDEVVPAAATGLYSAVSLGDAPQPAADPVSGILYPHSFIGECDVAASRVFDYFFATSNVADYYSCSVAGSSQIGNLL